MADKLTELLSKVVDEASFLEFVHELAKDCEKAARKQKRKPAPPYGPGAGGWENVTIEDFLEAAAAWAEDSQFGRQMASPELELHEVSEWQRFAAFLSAGKAYE